MGSRLWFAGLAILGCTSLSLAAGAGVDPVPTIATERTFDFSGSRERFRVPVGVDTIDVVACGAEGGMLVDPAEAVRSALGGLGGEARSRLTVEAAEHLAVLVGGAGDIAGGYNGGGAGPFPWGATRGAGGGGASDVRQSGAALGDRVLVAAGGGGGGLGLRGPIEMLLGGVGGGSSGGDAYSPLGGRGASPTSGGAAGVGDSTSGFAGALGRGGDGADLGGGGGGGLYGGGGGSVRFLYGGGGGGGGSSLGDSTTPGVCEGEGSVTMSFEQPQAVRPFGALVDEGDVGSTIVDVPVFLLFAVDEAVSADWSTHPGGASGLATAGEDFVAASGRVTFAPGQTETTVSVEVLADTEPEADLLWGEWLVIEFSNPSPNALLDTNPFHGSGLVIIVDDDAQAG